MGSSPHCRWQGDDLVLTVRISPGAQKDAVSVDASGIRIKVQAPPVDGKANKQLRKYLGQCFDLPQSRIQIVRGQSGRLKTIRIERPTSLPDFVRCPRKVDP